MTTKLNKIIETDPIREILAEIDESGKDASEAARRNRHRLEMGELSHADAEGIANFIGKQNGGDANRAKSVMLRMTLDKMELMHRAKLLEAAEE
jgi:hypothetical protein